MSRAGSGGMPAILHKAARAIRRRLIWKIVIPIAAVVFVSIFAWSVYHIEYQERFTRDRFIESAQNIGDTILLGLDHAMLLNARESTQAIVENTAQLDQLHAVRVIDKKGRVMFDSGNRTGNVEPQSSSLCQSCHAESPVPMDRQVYKTPDVEAFGDVDAEGAMLSLVLPIPNEPSCSVSTSCHFHDPDEKILGVLDLSFIVDPNAHGEQEFKAHTAYLALILFLLICAGLMILTHFLINRPINAIAKAAAVFSRGETPPTEPNVSEDEMGQLAGAVHEMGRELIAKNDQLARQMDHYQDLFEGVPCFITVQNRNFELLRYNRAFGERFSAQPGEYCYKAYKNRSEPCLDCPVVKTFETGLPQTTEESGCYKDGSKAHWIVRTAPVYGPDGEVAAAMEMCLDITERKELEYELKRSEMKYCDIFNNIPSSVFVLDEEDLSILDCNRGATITYGYDKDEFTEMSFLDLFVDSELGGFAESVADVLRSGGMDQARQRRKSGAKFYVSVNVSPSNFFDKNVFLVTVTDITNRLEAEQQLIQASKMATLGEMATGVAHEINQPLSVIQTSVDLVNRRLVRGEVPEKNLLDRLVHVIGAQIERADKIIGHMREFGRKADPDLETVDLNEVIVRSFEFFSQQLVIRDIEVIWELADKLPPVRCEPNRMEQVYINFLINARDAIEERYALAEKRGGENGLPAKRITVKTLANQEYVTTRISDTGVGVPEEIAPKIFEPFFTTKQVGKGTGLGLSISYGIVKEYGGDVYVNNNETGGASFHIRLPVAKTSRPGPVDKES